MQQKQWVIKPRPAEQDIRNLQNAINASELLATLLLQRGITSFDLARTFFNPSLKHLLAPSLMKDMDKAVERVTQAVENGENILVYGDYDVDGTTSVALMYSFLTESYDQVSYYLPDRYTEGYGVSDKGIDFAADNDVSLIIALDCGVKAVKQVKRAKELGMDFIICDHHLPGKELPPAVAMLNPLQPGCGYPYKSLSGCGIGFKLIQALTKAWSLEDTAPLKYLDLVAIAAACDIVPITGENRVLCHFGLKQISTALRPGLQLLLENAKKLKDGQLIQPLSISDVVFSIGPRINAAGRMEHGQLAVELLCAKTTKAAEAPAEAVVQNNDNRKKVDQSMLVDAQAMLEEASQFDHSTVLFADHWHKGVVGIMASRIQDWRYRPTIVLTASGDKVTGSARSVEGFDVHAAIDQCGDLLESYGGHRAAAGLTMPKENLEVFKQRFEGAVAASITPDLLVPKVEVDAVVALDMLTPAFFEAMERMGPFGPENMQPVFVVHGLMDAGKSRVVGSDQSHLKLSVKDGKGAATMEGIAFGLAHHVERIKKGEPFSAAFTLEWNYFNNLKKLQMMVRDIQFNDS